MAKSRKSTRSNKGESTSPRRSPGVRSKGRRWFVLIAALVGVAIVGVAVSRPYWGVGKALEDDAKGRPAPRENGVAQPTATAQLPAADSATVPSESSTVPPEPLPVAPNSSATPLEPSAVPPEPVPVAPNSSASRLQPWGPLPKTVEEFTEESLEAARRLTEDYPHSPEAFGVWGAMLYHNGKTIEAVKWLNQCLEKDPNRPNAWQMLGLIAFRNDRYEEAVRLLGKAEEVNSKLVGVHEDLATAYLEMGKPKLAVAALEGSLENSRSRENHYSLLAEAYSQLQEYEKARENYEAAIMLNISFSSAYYGLADIHKKLGQREKAVAYLGLFKMLQAKERQVEIQERKTDGTEKRAQALVKTHTDAARAYHRLGDRPKAEHHWRRATDVASKYGSFGEQPFNLDVAKQRWSEALEITRQLGQIAPDNPHYHRITGDLLTRLGQFKEAEEALGRAIELAPNDPGGYRLLAEVLLNQSDRSQEAKAISQKLIEMEQTAENYHLLAAARNKTGDSAGALAAIKAAVDLDPDNRLYRQVYDALRAKQ